MQKSYSPDDLEIAQIILKYLKKHPEARDTIQGIAEWWLLNEKIEQTLEKVQNALEYLVAQEFIVKRDYQGQKTAYALNNDKRHEIESAIHMLAQAHAIKNRAVS